MRLSLPQLTLLCRLASGEQILGVEETLAALEKRGLVSRERSTEARSLYPWVTFAGYERINAALGKRGAK